MDKSEQVRVETPDNVSHNESPASTVPPTPLQPTPVNRATKRKAFDDLPQDKRIEVLEGLCQQACKRLMKEANLVYQLRTAIMKNKGLDIDICYSRHAVTFHHAHLSHPNTDSKWHVAVEIESHPNTDCPSHDGDENGNIEEALPNLVKIE